MVFADPIQVFNYMAEYLLHMIVVKPYDLSLLEEAENLHISREYKFRMHNGLPVAVKITKYVACQVGLFREPALRCDTLTILFLP